MRKENSIRRGTQTESKASDQSADTWDVVQPAQTFTSKTSSMTPIQYVKASGTAYDLYRYMRMPFKRQSLLFVLHQKSVLRMRRGWGTLPRENGKSAYFVADYRGG